MNRFDEGEVSRLGSPTPWTVSREHTAASHPQKRLLPWQTEAKPETTTNRPACVLKAPNVAKARW
jgi:hypothetical protein